jgi:hypothetical protein
MKDIASITINKNRGWRGLAEVAVLNEENDLTAKHIFSFSQDMWKDLIIKHMITIASEDYYYVICFIDPEGRLPRPDQQRSVLIKNFTVKVQKVYKIKKTEWTSAEAIPYVAIHHHIKNRNNHTTSNWNCIGIRVMPTI